MAIKPKYFAIYGGPGYMSYDRESVMGFASLKDARRAFQAFYDGSVWHDEYIVNPDGYYVPWKMDTFSLTPGTSRHDWMDLYFVSENTTPGTYIMSEDLEVRMVFGERGGIVIEK